VERLSGIERRQKKARRSYPNIYISLSSHLSIFGWPSGLICKVWASCIGLRFGVKVCNDRSKALFPHQTIIKRKEKAFREGVGYGRTNFQMGRRIATGLYAEEWRVVRVEVEYD